MEFTRQLIVLCDVWIMLRHTRTTAAGRPRVCEQQDVAVEVYIYTYGFTTFYK